MISNTEYNFFISTELNAVLGRYELFTDRNASDHLALTAGIGDPMHEVCIHKVYLAHGNSKGEERGRSRHKNNSRRVVRNL